jgi:hypothetical protein
MREGATRWLRDKTQTRSPAIAAGGWVELTLLNRRGGDALERPGDDGGHWRVAALGPAHLGGAWAAATGVRKDKVLKSSIVGGG